MPKTQMLINYAPGEECRVAVVQDNKLEEFHEESTDAVSRVGNIYVGTVANVEPAVQAAFIDFGVEAHGFLHVTDLHPRYFPGEDDETTERVGRKTPRRERPPIQQCLRRGQEIAVQVLKEGVGTKGPALTSYLSIPGRFLVMMPQMDRVGVSRKVEDEELRNQMREILDQLELPEGFGFILRTAGMDRNKTELKRDLAYLQRLWKDMEKRWETGKGPRLLYTESDLLVRALRDLLSADTSEVVVDNEQALGRAARFLKIVAPRSQVKLYHYTGRVPLFHGFGIEEQIQNIHAREVPLPSGGRLVIDETEALVAIDVNSGKSRSARDSETNAFRTNIEAVEEICRQIRLRDLGGVIINDLIDMRESRHRREVEGRMRERLKRDRAKTTVLPISSFGILEMTRQRMRGSHESVHFAACPTCRGRGLVQRPDSVAGDALRSLAALLDHEKIAKVEMAVSPRVASELLSSRRRSLNRLERLSGKHVEVRVSETVAMDRVVFSAYDPAGADVDVTALPPARKSPEVQLWEGEAGEQWAVELADEPAVTEPLEEEVAALPTHPIELDDGEMIEGPTSDGAMKKKRRRRRGKRRGSKETTPALDAGMDSADAPQEPLAEESAPHDATEVEGDHAESPDAGTAEGEGPRKKRRRRRRRGRGGQRADDGSTAGMPETSRDNQAPSHEDAPTSPVESDDEHADATAETKPKARRRRRRGRGGGGGGNGQASPRGEGGAPDAGHVDRPASRSAPAAVEGPKSDAKPEPKPKRFLYVTRRKLSPSEVSRIPKE